MGMGAGMGAGPRLRLPTGGYFGGFARSGELPASCLGNYRRDESTTGCETDLRGS